MGGKIVEPFDQTLNYSQEKLKKNSPNWGMFKHLRL